MWLPVPGSVCGGGGGGGVCVRQSVGMCMSGREKERDSVMHSFSRGLAKKSVVHDILPVKLRHLQSQTLACQSPAELLFYC